MIERKINLERLKSLQSSIGYINFINPSEDLDSILELPTDLHEAIIDYIISKETLNDILSIYGVEEV